MPEVTRISDQSTADQEYAPNSSRSLDAWHELETSRLNISLSFGHCEVSGFAIAHWVGHQKGIDRKFWRAANQAWHIRRRYAGTGALFLAASSAMSQVPSGRS